MKKNIILLFCVILLSQINTAYAQGGGGRSTTPSNPKPKENEIPKNKGNSNTPNRTPRKTPTIKKPIVKKTPTSKPNLPKVTYASLSIVVSEPESEVFLADRDGNIFEDAESAFTGEGGSPLVFDEVSTGTYTLTVRKPGFFDVEKQITVKGGKINPFPITLRPSMPFLSVSTNVDGASIVIKNVGEFENQISDYPLTPGTYHLSVSKNGYETETREVVLNNAGERKNLPITLRENPASAVGKGEARRIAVKMQINGQLLPGELIVERNRLTIKGTNSNLNFIVTRGKAVDFVESEDSVGSYIEFKASGIFKSNPERNNRLVRLYPNPQDVKSTFQLMKSWRLGDFSK